MKKKTEKNSKMVNKISSQASPYDKLKPAEAKELKEADSALANTELLKRPYLNPSDFDLVLTAYMDMWNDNTITNEMYNKLKKKNLLKILEDLTTWKYYTNEISPRFVDAVNKYIKPSSANSYSNLFANNGLILLKEGTRYNIVIPASYDYEKEFGKLTTNLQKDETFKKYQNKRVLWKGLIVDVKENIISLKNLKSSSLFMDVMIDGVQMDKQDLLNLNAGNYVWYTGILWGKEDAVSPWILTNGQVVAVIQKK